MLTSTPLSLDQWLDAIEKIHPLSMDFKMERITEVAKRMELLKPQALVITVAGTNGKGSTSTTLSCLIEQLGFKVGLYTSPHLYRFNERIKVNQTPIEDQNLIDIFKEITIARNEITLTYFEYATLAALEHFSREKCDVIILEVGLGGRLDATNIIDADIAVITPIDVDHIAQLGNDRESIAKEKAGIFRQNQSIVISEQNPPNSLLEIAKEYHANVLLRGRDFTIYPKQDHSWQFNITHNTINTVLNNLNKPKLEGAYQYDNAACALAVLFTPKFIEFFSKIKPAINIETPLINEALSKVTLEGRLQTYQNDHSTWVFDVTHNPHGAKGLATWLKSTNFSKVHVIIGMLKDKDAISVAKQLLPNVDVWYFIGLEGDRGQTSQELAGQFKVAQDSLKQSILRYHCFDTIDQAFSYCLEETRKEKHSLILVIGSFYTVSDGLKWYLNQKN